MRLKQTQFPNLAKLNNLTCTGSYSSSVVIGIFLAMFLKSLLTIYSLEGAYDSLLISTAPPVADRGDSHDLPLLVFTPLYSPHPSVHRTSKQQKMAEMIGCHSHDYMCHSRLGQSHIYQNNCKNLSLGLLSCYNPPTSPVRLIGG